MTYIELLDHFVKENEGARLSTKILALQGFIASLGENGIKLTGDNLNQLIHSLGIKNNKVYPWVQEYLRIFVAKSHRLKPKKQEEPVEEEALPATVNKEKKRLEDLKKEDFAAPEDTPDDMEYLATLGVKNPERPWEK